MELYILIIKNNMSQYNTVHEALLLDSSIYIYLDYIKKNLQHLIPNSF